MADTLPTVTIPSFSYSAGTTDIGKGYAAGITAAGEGIAKGLHDVLDVATRNQNANDVLQAMNQNKILSDEAYKSVAGKSLGAKESMLGLYAGEWIKQQAQERELQKIGYTGTVTSAVEHGKLLDTYSLNKMMLKAGLPVPGVKPGEIQLTPPAQNQPVSNQPVSNQPAPRALPQKGPPPVRRALPNIAGTPQNPTPLASGDIYNPPLVTTPQLAATTQLPVGPPVGKGDTYPPGSIPGEFRGKQGIKTPDGVFHPFK
jgi:hypothetical protein